MIEFKSLPIAKLAMNTGQIEGLPANPRQWTQDDLEKLAASIDQTPELLEARGAIVVQHGNKYIVLGGNMRLTAAKKLGLKEMPCAVLPADTPTDKLAQIVIKDNGAFGAWDFDALANEWDDLPLTEWGVPAWEKDKEKEENGGDKDLSDSITMEYKLEVECATETEQEQLYNEFINRGYKCKVLTL